MARKIRIVLALLILALSISLLIWGFMPARHETRVEPIPHEQLELPTPASFRFDMTSPLSASFSQPILFT
jgi:hypothetical protein